MLLIKSRITHLLLNRWHLSDRTSDLQHVHAVTSLLNLVWKACTNKRHWEKLEIFMTIQKWQKTDRHGIKIRNNKNKNNSDSMWVCAPSQCHYSYDKQNNGAAAAGALSYRLHQRLHWSQTGSLFITALWLSSIINQIHYSNHFEDTHMI